MEHAYETRHLSLSRSHLFMAPPSSPPVANGRLIILYASQTGNAMDVAQRVGREAKCGGCLNVDVLSMDSFNPIRSEPSTPTLMIPSVGLHVKHHLLLLPVCVELPAR
jgi:sulfite reductase alpha subunit-like flavoprotein